MKKNIRFTGKQPITALELSSRFGLREISSAEFRTLLKLRKLEASQKK